jgi:hypothetical protein
MVNALCLFGGSSVTYPGFPQACGKLPGDSSNDPTAPPPCVWLPVDDRTGGQVSGDGVRQSGAADYMLRTTQQHHVQLSLMADQKANILIASCSILLTFSFANFDRTDLFWGFVALFLFSFMALVLAVLAVIPRLGSNLGGKPNLLFFGDFNALALDDYVDEMKQILDSDEAIYETILTDIHALGSAIQHRKYRYLAMSYRVFLAGIIASGVLFLVQIAIARVG